MDNIDPFAIIREYLNKSNDDNFNKCKYCHVQLNRFNSLYYICPMCGLQVEDLVDEDIYTNDNFHSYNSGIHTSLKIYGGANSSLITSRNNRLKCLNGDSNHYKHIKILKKLQNLAYQTPDDEDHIPQTVITEVALTYSTLQQNDSVIKRAGTLDGALAQLMLNKCIEMGFPRKPKTIIRIMNIEDNQLTIGNKTLRKIGNKNAIFQADANINDYINQYFDKLSLEDYVSYKQFVYDLIIESDINKIKIEENSARPTTRCTGCIYILSIQLKIKHINKELISNKLNISPNTYIRFVNMIKKYKHLENIRKVFIKYNIPQL